MKAVGGNTARPVVVRAGRRLLQTTQAFDTYWYLAAERQALFRRRLAGLQPPWTEDPILAGHRFTNVYRVTDRVSQYVVKHVIGDADSRKPTDVVFRVLLFKIFNRIDTWQYLEERLGQITTDAFDSDAYTTALSERMDAGHRLYSGAYIMPPPRLGMRRKHANHVKLLQQLYEQGVLTRLSAPQSMVEAFEVLLGVPSFGDFLAYQFTVDINYSDVWDFSEMDFVRAGPGARSGIRKCFTDTDGLSDEEVIRVMSEIADSQFARLDLSFHGLGDRPMQLIDCQNMFCELDKYARVAHPELDSGSGRRRIKQNYRPTSRPVSCDIPAKWNVNMSGWLAGTTPVDEGNAAGS